MRFAPALVLNPLAWACLACAAVFPAAARCVDEARIESSTEPAAAGAPPAIDPRTTLQTLVREALERSQQIGAARLVAEAARDDIEEARAAKSVQASLGAGMGGDAAYSRILTETTAMQLRASPRPGPWPPPPPPSCTGPAFLSSPTSTAPPTTSAQPASSA